MLPLRALEIPSPAAPRPHSLCLDPVRRRLCLAAASSALLSACASRPLPRPVPPASPPPRAISLTELADHLRRSLQGIPVSIELKEPRVPTPAMPTLLASQTLQVQILQPHDFDPASPAIKPALAAVLDELVEALRGSPRWLVEISGPLDGRGSPFLGQDRAAAIRDYLISRGSLASRFSPPQNSIGPLTELLIIERS